MKGGVQIVCLAILLNLMLQIAVVTSDYRCRAIGGHCQDIYKDCNGDYKQGLCDGDWYRQCCKPGGRGQFNEKFIQNENFD